MTKREWKKAIKQFMEDKYYARLNGEQKLEFAERGFKEGYVYKDCTANCYRECETDLYICPVPTVEVSLTVDELRELQMLAVMGYMKVKRDYPKDIEWAERIKDKVFSFGA